MADDKENNENRSTVGDGQEENLLIEKDSETRRGEDEGKPSEEESRSQSTERKETKNKEPSSSAGKL